MNLNDLTEKIIGCAIEVHKNIGPGLLESAYEECLCYELQHIGLHIERQKELPVIYKHLKLNCNYRLDIVIENKVILELKAVDTLLPVHEAQLLTYLKLTEVTVGLLINFNVPVLRKGIRRLVNNFIE